MLFDWWLVSQKSRDSRDSGIGESWRQSSIGWGPRELLCCSLSACPCAQADQSAKYSLVIDEITKGLVSALQCGGCVPSTVSLRRMIINWLIGSYKFEELAVE